MTRFDQTILHTEEQNGNCWATCLACLLNMTFIPELDVMAEDHWWERSESIAQCQGFTLLEIERGADGKIPVVRMPVGCHVILSGRSPRFEGKVNHSVIGRICADEEKGMTLEIEHDPHPSRAGLDSIDWITFAIPLARS